MLDRCWAFFKKETVLCISAICAVATMFLVPPDEGYSEYIDFRVLCLLLCLMAVVEGFRRCGAFEWLTFQLLRRSHSGKVLGMVLVLLPFFSSMLLTNDVALLIFVPFTLLFLAQIGCSSAGIFVLVLQTIAANLGSMATPVGNPQNLYLYEAYHLGAKEFFTSMLPLTVVSMLCLMAASLLVLPKVIPGLTPPEKPMLHTRKLLIYGVLFGLCLLTVFRILPYGIMTVAVLSVIAVTEPRLLRRLDIPLLLTFVCFFIVSGNLSRIEEVRGMLRAVLERNTLLTAVGTSQIISNVPAAVLLSGFTDQWKPLLAGVNIGGLGTPIASLASLITLKLYLHQPEARIGKFLVVFTVANAVGLVILLAAAWVL